ncbi:MAG: hypothetical protein WBV94_00515 [Blastocatellia bacterium]
MTTTATRHNFAGPYKALLAELAELIDWLWAEHDKSFVKAGDNKVYAFGDNGYVLVFDESQWGGMIEFMAPKGAFTIKPAEDGTINVTSTIADEQAGKQLFKESLDYIRSYYEKRYWQTPKTSVS